MKIKEVAEEQISEATEPPDPVLSPDFQDGKVSTMEISESAMKVINSPGINSKVKESIQKNYQFDPELFKEELKDSIELEMDLDPPILKKIKTNNMPMPEDFMDRMAEISLSNKKIEDSVIQNTEIPIKNAPSKKLSQEILDNLPDDFDTKQQETERPEQVQNMTHLLVKNNLPSTLPKTMIVSQSNNPNWQAIEGGLQALDIPKDPMMGSSCFKYQPMAAGMLSSLDNQPNASRNPNSSQGSNITFHKIKPLSLLQSSENEKKALVQQSSQVQETLEVEEQEEQENSPLKDQESIDKAPEIDKDQEGQDDPVDKMSSISPIAHVPSTHRKESGSAILHSLALNSCQFSAVKGGEDPPGNFTTISKGSEGTHYYDLEKGLANKLLKETLEEKKEVFQKLQKIEDRIFVLQKSISSKGKKSRDSGLPEIPFNISKTQSMIDKKSSSNIEELAAPEETLNRLEYKQDKETKDAKDTTCGSFNLQRTANKKSFEEDLLPAPELEIQRISLESQKKPSLRKAQPVDHHLTTKSIALQTEELAREREKSSPSQTKPPPLQKPPISPFSKLPNYRSVSKDRRPVSFSNTNKEKIFVKKRSLVQSSIEPGCKNHSESRENAERSAGSHHLSQFRIRDINEDKQFLRQFSMEMQARSKLIDQDFSYLQASIQAEEEQSKQRKPLKRFRKLYHSKRYDQEDSPQKMEMASPSYAPRGIKTKSVEKSGGKNFNFSIKSKGPNASRSQSKETQEARSKRLKTQSSATEFTQQDSKEPRKRRLMVSNPNPTSVFSPLRPSKSRSVRQKAPL